MKIAPLHYRRTLKCAMPSFVCGLAFYFSAALPKRPIGATLMLEPWVISNPIISLSPAHFLQRCVNGNEKSEVATRLAAELRCRNGGIGPGAPL
jgi:hypothetical protein